MRQKLLLSIVDQALLSALNLSLALALIAFTTPTEFGVYALYFAALLIAHSIQNALVVMPLNFLLPGKAIETQNQSVQMLTTIQTLFLSFVVCAALGASLFLGSGWRICLAASVYIGTGVMREYARNLFIVQGNVRSALMLDGLFAVSSCVSILVFWQLLPPAAAFLAGQAVGCFIGLIATRPKTQMRLGSLKNHFAAYAQIRNDVGWSLLGASQTEVQLRGYVFIVQMWMGLAALGVLQAGRIVISPLLLIATAWARIARPQFVEMHNNQDGSAAKLLFQGIFVILACAVFYGLSIWVLWPFIEKYVFKAEYGDMWPLVAVWWSYACVVSVNVCLSTLLQARRQFKLLTGIGFLSAAASLGGMLLLSFTSLPLLFAVWVLLAAEMIELAAQLYGAKFKRKYATNMAETGGDVDEK